MCAMLHLDIRVVSEVCMTHFPQELVVPRGGELFRRVFRFGSFLRRRSLTVPPEVGTSFAYWVEISYMVGPCLLCLLLSICGLH